MKKLCVAATCLALLIGGSLFVFQSGASAAQRHGPMHGRGCSSEPELGIGMDWCGHGMMHALNLSKEQTSAVAGLRGKFTADTRQLRDELLQKRIEARKLYTDPQTNEATITAKQKEIYGLQQTLHDRTLQLRLEERRILTPEQLKKLNEIIGEKAGRGKKKCID